MFYGSWISSSFRWVFAFCRFWSLVIFFLREPKVVFLLSILNASIIWRDLTFSDQVFTPNNSCPIWYSIFKPSISTYSPFRRVMVISALSWSFLLTIISLVLLMLILRSNSIFFCVYGICNGLKIFKILSNTIYFSILFGISSHASWNIHSVYMFNRSGHNTHPCRVPLAPPNVNL